MIKYFLVFKLALITMIAYGQPAISVEVSADTIETGKTVEIKYTIQNGNGKFSMPVLDSLPVVSGPNSSSSFMYQNGEQSYSQSYSFVLLGLEDGTLRVPEASYVTEEEIIFIEPVEIVVGKAMGQSAATSENTESKLSKSKREKRVF